MRKCDKKVKKGQGKRRQSNKGNSNDGWVGEVREWIKEDRVTEGTVTMIVWGSEGQDKKRQNNRRNNNNG